MRELMEERNNGANFRRSSASHAGILLDYVLIALYIGALRGVFLTLFADPTSSEITAFLLLVVPVLLYFALLECSPWQASWGKRKMWLIVMKSDGKRLSLPRSLLRSLLKVVAAVDHCDLDRRMAQL